MFAFKVDASTASRLGDLDAGADMDFTFADLVVEAARTRRLGCGTILGAGTIANRHAEAKTNGRKTSGYACIAEARSAEKAARGKAENGLSRHWRHGAH